MLFQSKCLKATNKVFTRFKQSVYTLQTLATSYIFALQSSNKPSQIKDMQKHGYRSRLPSLLFRQRNNRNLAKKALFALLGQGNILRNGRLSAPLEGTYTLMRCLKCPNKLQIIKSLHSTALLTCLPCIKNRDVTIMTHPYINRTLLKNVRNQTDLSAIILLVTIVSFLLTNDRDNLLVLLYFP